MCRASKKFRAPLSARDNYNQKPLQGQHRGARRERDDAPDDSFRVGARQERGPDTENGGRQQGPARCERGGET